MSGKADERTQRITKTRHIGKPSTDRHLCAECGDVKGKCEHGKCLTCDTCDKCYEEGEDWSIINA